MVIDSESTSKKSKMEAPKKPDPFALKEPVKPVSTRRSVIEKLDLNTKVKGIAKDRAKKTVDNYKLVNAASAAVQSGKLADQGKDQSRKFVVELSKKMETTRKKRQQLKTLTKQKLATTSQLTQDGQAENVSKAFLEYTGEGDREFEFPFGNRKGKVSTDSSEVGVLNPTYKVGEQPLQMLGHLSQLFMNKVNDYEYESLLVNDRVFIASNAQAKIAQFKNEKLQDFLAAAAKKVVADASAASKDLRAYQIGALSEALKLDPTSTSDLTPQQKDGAALLAEYEVGYHIDHEVRKDVMSFLGLLQHQAKNALVMSGPSVPDTAKDLVRGGKKYSVHLVQPSEKGGWHAEQALALTLILAGWTSGAVVSGTKQPCFCCWLTLSLLPQCGFPLTYNLAPGFIWDTTTMTGLTKVAKALGIETVSVLLKLFKDAESLTEDQFMQFMTALKTQTVLTVDVTIGGKGLTARDLTQNQSARSFGFPREQEDLRGAPFLAEPPSSPFGGYGSPPSSPGR